jgi:hypothetical protein
VFSASFVVVHDTESGAEHNVTELTSWKQVIDPFFVLVVLDVETWRDDTTLVDAALQFNDNLTSTVIINNFEFTNVTYAKKNKKKTMSKPPNKF